MSRKKVLLLFSGGLDSTYLLYKNVLENNAIILGYTDIKNNASKTPSEQKARKAIKDWFYDKYPHLYNSYNVKDMENEVHIHSNMEGFGFAQLPVALFAMLTMCDQFTDEIQLGYCMNDDMISYIADLSAAFDALRPMFVNKQIKLVFPLIKVSKVQMIDELPTSLLKLVWSCENPNHIDTPCGDCVPCRRYRSIGEERSLSGTKLLFDPATMLSKDATRSYDKFTNMLKFRLSMLYDYTIMHFKDEIPEVSLFVLPYMKCDDTGIKYLVETTGDEKKKYRAITIDVKDTFDNDQPFSSVTMNDLLRREYHVFGCSEFMWRRMESNNSSHFIYMVEIEDSGLRPANGGAGDWPNVINNKQWITAEEFGRHFTGADIAKA